MKEIGDMYLNELIDLKKKIDGRIFKLKQEKATAVDLIFTLSMPSVGSWNGKWSGAGGQYTVKRRVKKKDATKLVGESFRHNFGDGWVASIKVTLAKHREKVTNKFCGYEWMVTDIIAKGKIEG